MIDSPVPGYLKEVEDAGWVQEIIMEAFDGAIELMGETSVVYGGAVRDCLAGMDLLGDLDIAVSRPSFGGISEGFQKSTKWVPNTEPDLNEKPSEWAKSRNSGDLARTLAPMSGVTAFRGVSNRIVQLITTKRHTKDPFQDVLYMARTVDIVCCGVVMAADGRVFEAVPGAYQDCKDRVLRLNTASETIFVDALPARVEKLVKRGWKNTIDVKRALRDIKLAQDRLKKKQERQMMSMRRKMAVPEMATITPGVMSEAEMESTHNKFGEVVQEYSIRIPTAHHTEMEGGYTSEIKPEVFTELFDCNKQHMANEITRICTKYKTNARIKWTPIGKVYITAANYDICKRIMIDLNGMLSRQREQQKKQKDVYPARFGGVTTGRLHTLATDYGRAKPPTPDDFPSEAPSPWVKKSIPM
jgi:hypothetical protein